MRVNFLQMDVARARAVAIRPVCSAQGQQALLSLYPKLRLTTARIYHATLSGDLDNDASMYLDEGCEPYLVSDEALLQGLCPFIPVYDVLAEPQAVGTGRRREECIGLDLLSGLCLVPGDALVAWR